MRLYFSNIQKPKKAAKTIASIVSGIRLSNAQNAVAIISGYRNWHDLELGHSLAPDTPLHDKTTNDDFRKQISAHTSSLTQNLNITWSDALYGLSMSRLLTSAPLNPADYEIVWLSLFSQFHPPLEGRHSPGTLVKAKCPGGKPEPAYIKAYGHGVDLIVNGSVRAARADFEIVKPRIPLQPFVPARLKYAYGIWHEKDGSKVLYSRDYKPLWRLRDGMQPQRLHPWEWVEWKDQSWFWDDNSNPWQSPERQQEEEDRLKSYGVTALPMLTDVLPRLLFDPRHKVRDGISDALELMKQDIQLAKNT